MREKVKLEKDIKRWAYRKIGEQSAVFVCDKIVRVDVHVLVEWPNITKILVGRGRAPMSATHCGGVDERSPVGNKV